MNFNNVLEVNQKEMETVFQNNIQKLTLKSFKATKKGNRYHNQSNKKNSQIWAYLGVEKV